MLFDGLALLPALLPMSSRPTTIRHQDSIDLVDGGAWNKKEVEKVEALRLAQTTGLAHCASFGP
ncbi:hypothetical protein E4U54_003163 [Claviceps lovelessii]|nr:hypothetical protein E4U54_003163 [Claviceps lovelessii]